ncbi:D-glycero-beta-D-manno-heptose 1-phosphate adenylyltransferase [bacterium]|nr:D-glycero-beta-D-manno-heptose 1-phosphate adenylyltransferase [bacterium]
MGEVIGVEALLPRLTGKRVVFTNGCFDLLHVGHLRTLQWARQQGEVLVVGLNSDASVRGLKGPLRPLVNQDDRAEMLAGFACVDFVVLFEEADPLRLLAQIRPAVHVKGGDYRPDQLPEAELVRSWGGEVLVTPLIEGRSTTSMQQKISRSDLQ